MRQWRRRGTRRGLRGEAGSSEITAESIRALADDSAEVQSYALDMNVTFTGLSQVEGVPEGTPDEAA